MKIGELLKAEREKRGLSLLNVEEDTKIRAKYLAALEEEDYAEIPGEVYVVGFLRNYARYLELDASEILREYHESRTEREETGETDETEESPPLPEQKSPSPPVPPPLRKESPYRQGSRVSQYIFYGIVAALTLALLYWGMSVLAQKKAPAPQTPIKNQTQAVKPKPRPQPQPQNQGVNLKIVAKENCWIRVTVDGQVAFEQTLTPGNEKSFQGNQQIILRLGNAGGVTATLNGREQPPLGTSGEPVTKIFNKSGTME